MAGSAAASVERTFVISKARFVVWPFDRVGGIDDGFNGRG
jgi:hypothetical protein